MPSCGRQHNCCIETPFCCGQDRETPNKKCKLYVHVHVAPYSVTAYKRLQYRIPIDKTSNLNSGLTPRLDYPTTTTFAARASSYSNKHCATLSHPLLPYPSVGTSVFKYMMRANAPLSSVCVFFFFQQGCMKFKYARLSHDSKKKNTICIVEYTWCAYLNVFKLGAMGVSVLGVDRAYLPLFTWLHINKGIM